MIQQHGAYGSMMKKRSFTTKEFDLLTFLAGHPNHVYTKEELFREIWDMESSRRYCNCDCAYQRKFARKDRSTIHQTHSTLKQSGELDIDSRYKNMRKKTIKERLQEGSFNTVRVIGLGFLFVILIGAVLLWMPFSVTTSMKFTDALFTSVTAVCVTGLVTVTPAVQFTVVGKVILLFLIQIGGLGIIACVVAFMILAGQRISLRRRVMIQESYGLDTLSGMVQYIIRIIKGTFFVEGIGALAYSFYFVPKYGVLKGIAYAIFHAVSAFCNAGIDILGSSSYMHMVTSPIINFTTIFLVVSGGLGFVVWYDILNNIKQVRSIKDVRRNFFHRLSLQSKIVLTMTAGLLFVWNVCISFIGIS